MRCMLFKGEIILIDETVTGINYKLELQRLAVDPIKQT